jgi:hypothetical protein
VPPFWDVPLLYVPVPTTELLFCELLVVVVEPLLDLLLLPPHPAASAVSATRSRP